MEMLLPYILDDKLIENLVLAHKTSIHVAFIVMRGQVIAKATNRVGSRSKGAGYSDCTIHAERNVVKELGNFDAMRGATMYVVRISRARTLKGRDKIQTSSPCYDCHVFLTKCHEKYGLRRVFYSTHDFVEMDFTDRPPKIPLEFTKPWILNHKYT